MFSWQLKQVERERKKRKKYKSKVKEMNKNYFKKLNKIGGEGELQK